ncbi:MAG: repair protein RecN [Bacteroidetes bacterium]|nr:repair protein RecN [Bacteroidota bacterium]
MLRSLHIRNYALIEEISVELPSGLVILTGETGAGKSILIGALGLLLGERASSDIVRSGAERAVVEGVFDAAGNGRLKRLLEGLGVEGNEEVIVRREISAKGQSRCFVNDSPVTLAAQKQIGELLVDLHGQHEHQSLLRADTHIALVDDFGGLDGMVAEFRTAYDRLQDLSVRRNELQAREKQLREKREFYAFQLQDIDAVAPQPGEEEQLESELRILENSEKLFGATGTLYDILYGGDQSVHDQLVVVRNQLQNLAEIDRQFAATAAECASAEAIVKELAKFIQGYNARVEFAPERLEELRERLGRLAMLKKKYGGSLEAVLEHRTTIAREVELAENFDGVLETLELDLAAARRACLTLAERLSAKRHETARKIDRAIVGELSKLGIPGARFSTRIEQREAGGTGPAVQAGRRAIALNARGYDTVEFAISTNRGEEERPLAKVASGGEISRVMLALKSILAKSDRLPVLVFDEIDVGVSGRIAQSVGLSLKALSGFHQVIAITHLPQIAGLADAHFVVVKSEKAKRSVTSIRKLTLDEQVEEVAKLMSGARVTEAGLAGARELMKMR